MPEFYFPKPLLSENRSTQQGFGIEGLPEQVPRGKNGQQRKFDPKSICREPQALEHYSQQPAIPRALSPKAPELKVLKVPLVFKTLGRRKPQSTPSP